MYLYIESMNAFFSCTYMCSASWESVLHIKLQSLMKPKGTPENLVDAANFSTLLRVVQHKMSGGMAARSDKPQEVGMVNGPSDGPASIIRCH